jgi:hypothetical protein
MSEPSNTDPAPTSRQACVLDGEACIALTARESMAPSKLSLPVACGVLTLVSLVPLLAWDAFPGAFPARAHDVLGAVPLVLVALAYLVYQRVRRVGALEIAKALLCALAFFFWALNQALPDDPRATLFNDIAIAAFVLDLVLVIFGWPPAADAAPDAPPGIAPQQESTGP